MKAIKGFHEGLFLHQMSSHGHFQNLMILLVRLSFLWVDCFKANPKTHIFLQTFLPVLILDLFGKQDITTIFLFPLVSFYALRF